MSALVITCFIAITVTIVFSWLKYTEGVSHRDAVTYLGEPNADLGWRDEKRDRSSAVTTYPPL